MILATVVFEDIFGILIFVTFEKIRNSSLYVNFVLVIRGPLSQSRFHNLAEMHNFELYLVFLSRLSGAFLSCTVEAKNRTGWTRNRSVVTLVCDYAYCNEIIDFNSSLLRRTRFYFALVKARITPCTPSPVPPVLGKTLCTFYKT